MTMAVVTWHDWPFMSSSIRSCRRARARRDPASAPSLPARKRRQEGRAHVVGLAGGLLEDDRLGPGGLVDPELLAVGLARERREDDDRVGWGGPWAQRTSVFGVVRRRRGVERGRTGDDEVGRVVRRGGDEALVDLASLDARGGRREGERPSASERPAWATEGPQSRTFSPAVATGYSVRSAE